MIASAGTEYRQYFGREQLEVTPTAINLERVQSKRAPVLLDHKRSDQIGVVETAEVRDGQFVTGLRFSKNADADKIYQDILDGIRSQVSCGYRIDAYEVDDTNPRDPLFRITKWQPYEVSVVSIGADPKAIVKRDGYLSPADGNQPQLPAPVNNTNADIIASVMRELGINPDTLKAQGNGDVTTETVKRLLEALNLRPEQLRGEPIQDADKDIMRRELIADAMKLGVQAEGDAFISDIWQRRFENWGAQEIMDQMAIWRKQVETRYPDGRQTTELGKDGDRNQSLQLSEYFYI